MVETGGKEDEEDEFTGLGTGVCAVNIGCHLSPCFFPLYTKCSKTKQNPKIQTNSILGFVLCSIEKIFSF